MDKLLVKLKFNGSGFVGWQAQQNGLSVQQCVDSAVQKIFGAHADITGCSRTDSKVHANEYCLCFTPPRQMELRRIAGALNAALPDSIAVFDVRPVAADFHPRYDAAAKEYVYKIYDGRAPNPFLNGLAYHYYKKLDVKLLNLAADRFVGKKDFRAFMAQGSKITDTVRQIYYCNVKRQDDTVNITVCANGFLYKMVRIIVGTLLGVNDRKFEISDIDKIILSKDRSKAGKTAPPYGLYLNRVFYDLKEVDITDERCTRAV